MSHHPQPPPKAAAEPLPPPPRGDAARWGAYVEAAIPRIVMTTAFLPEKQPSLHLIATAPGFDGWQVVLRVEADFLHRLLASLQDWLEYRLANRLSIPRLPDVATPTLEDYEEYDAEQDYRWGRAMLQTGEPPHPMDDVFAEIEAGR